MTMPVKEWTIADERIAGGKDRSRIRVNVCVSHPLVSAGLYAVLAKHPDIDVLSSGSGHSRPGADSGNIIVAETTDSICHVVPSRRGAAGMGRPSRRIIAVGNCNTGSSITTAFCSGVRGFVGVRAVETELPEAIRAVARGHAYLSSDMASTLLNWLSAQMPADLARFYHSAELLSSREREVLLLLGNGHSNAEIATKLVISETTVRSHLCHILTKLGLQSRAETVLFGYQFRLSMSGVIEP
jgi:DNA-binding NarL/FixJ family response regulator